MPVLLVVDDESSILLAFRRAFRDTGLEVLTADAGHAGLALARERHPDVVVLDVCLADQSGLEVFRQLRDWDAAFRSYSSPARPRPTPPSRP